MMKREKRFFLFSHYVYYTMIELEKSFFLFSHYVHYTMIKRKKVFFVSALNLLRHDHKKRNGFLLHHYLDYATIIKKYPFLISLRRSLCKCLLRSHYVTNMLKKSPNDILPRKIFVT